MLYLNETYTELIPLKIQDLYNTGTVIKVLQKAIRFNATSIVLPWNIIFVMKIFHKSTPLKLKFTLNCCRKASKAHRGFNALFLLRRQTAHTAQPPSATHRSTAPSRPQNPEELRPARPAHARHRRGAMAGAAGLWEEVRALLPDSEEELSLALSGEVDDCIPPLLLRARALLYGAAPPCEAALRRLGDVVRDYAWEKLNAVPWRDVGKAWRQVYAYGCLFGALAEVAARRPLAAAVRLCDMGLLMGASVQDDVLARLVRLLQAHLPRAERRSAAPASAKVPPVRRLLLGPPVPRGSSVAVRG